MDSEPYKSALIAAPRLLLRGAAIENAAIAAAVVVFYCGTATVVVFYCGTAAVVVFYCGAAAVVVFTAAPQ